ncbi:hypothetical protein DXT57_07870 [Stenotrophomonas maltophilia]|uniref:hypothetical protein n=1 Tax=Stenotrophomonas maltophilia TaxID=40324 RepID=UPI000E2722D2|nr:hypothetical protein [Stenotrophomonas maltophilia]REC87108.1 hypothetical protein DXT57_07870 [Stenotrophomonas maltophilia]
MTISANDRRKTYVGNGVATAFNGPRAFLSSHIQVFTGTHPVYNLVPPSQYVVTGLRANTSKITFNAAPALNLDILILRMVPMDQPADITNQGAFLPEIHEDAFDYRVMQLQQLLDSGLQLVLDPETGQFVWDAKGNRIANVGDAVADADAMNRRAVLMLIEQIQGGGGTIGVTPKFWAFEGDGVVTDFPLEGADVLDPLFYDTAVETAAGSNVYPVSKPGIDGAFTIVAGVLGAPPAIRFNPPLGDGVRGFTTLRGYARPWIGQPPVYTVAPPHRELERQHHRRRWLAQHPDPGQLGQPHHDHHSQEHWRHRRLEGRAVLLGPAAGRRRCNAGDPGRGRAAQHSGELPTQVPGAAQHHQRHLHCAGR